MSECYLCGAYISPGSGFRRDVQTSTSSRIYFGKRIGTSVGQSHGLRTLCQRCAEIYDIENSASSKTAFYTVWAVSALIGFVILSASGGALGALIGLAFIAGAPAWLYESAQRKSIERKMQESAQLHSPQYQPKISQEHIEPDISQLIARDGEEFISWAKRAERFVPISGGIEFADWLDAVVKYAEDRNVELHLGRLKIPKNSADG